MHLSEGGFIFDPRGYVCHNAEIPRSDLARYPTIKAAKEHLPVHPDAVICKVHNFKITEMYFTQLQMKRGFYQRLNIFQGCYGSIKPRERKA